MEASFSQRSTSVSEQVNRLQPKRWECFVPGCEHREDNISLILRHTRSDHAVDYCRGCCDFFEVRGNGNIYCRQCYRFCMSPTCVEAILLGTGTAQSQGHDRNHACPKVRGTSTGVSSEALLDYLMPLYTERQSQTEAPAEAAVKAAVKVAIKSDIKNDANSSPTLGTNAGPSSARSDGNYALGAGASQTTIGSLAPSVNLAHCTNAEESGTTDGSHTNGNETNIGHRHDADGDTPLQDGSEPNPEFDWNLLLGDSSTTLNPDDMDFHYHPPVSFQ